MFKKLKAQSEKKAEQKEALEKFEKEAKVRKDAIDWNTSLMEIVRKESKRNRTLVMVFSACMAVMAVGYMVVFSQILPLKTIEPYVIKVDNATGMTDVVYVDDLTKIPTSEVMDRYWLNHYIVSRESYQFDQLSGDYNVVRELSFPEAFDPYAKTYNPRNGLQFDYRKSVTIKAQVKNFMFNDRGPIEVVEQPSRPPVKYQGGNVTVRFTKEIKSGNTQAPRIENWIVQISYRYMPELHLSEQRRLVNPFGFKVVDYRASREL